MEIVVVLHIRTRTHAHHGDRYIKKYQFLSLIDNVRLLLLFSSDIEIYPIILLIAAV